MKCPYCAEDIKDEAVACRYCGRDLSLFKPMLKRISLLEERTTELAVFLNTLGKNDKLSIETYRSGRSVGLVLSHCTLVVLLPAALIMASALRNEVPVILILHASTLLFGFWAGMAWSGGRPKAYALLGSAVGLIGGAGVLVRIYPSLPSPLNNLVGVVVIFLALEILTATTLFLSGGLFANIVKRNRFSKPYRGSEFVEKVTRKAAGPGKEPTQLSIALVQATIPGVLGLITAVVNVLLQQD